MLLAYLLSTHKVGKTMNAYQLLRNALHFLGKTYCVEVAYHYCSFSLMHYNPILVIKYICFSPYNSFLYFLCLASTDLTDHGITLARNPDSKAVSSNATIALIS